MMRKDCISHLTIPMDKTRWLALIFLLMLTNIHYGAERIDSTKAKYSMSLTLSAIANTYGYSTRARSTNFRQTFNWS